jgi:TolB protein
VPDPGSGTNATDIYVMNADGSNLHRIASYPTGIGSFAWSPDGKRLAVTVYGDGIGQNIRVLNVDGSGEVQLTAGQWIDSVTGWSPDGQRIGFIRRALPTRKHASEPADMYIIDADGTNEVRLTDTSFSEDRLVWVPSAR